MPRLRRPLRGARPQPGGRRAALVVRRPATRSGCSRCSRVGTRMSVASPSRDPALLPARRAAAVPPAAATSSVIDVERARADTPGCARVAHLNNAGAALPPAPVLDAVVEHLEREAQIGGYEAARERADRLEHTYDAIAALLGCARDEIAVVENATRAWDMAFYALRFAPGDRILTTGAEYASNYIALRQVADRTGATVEFVPEDDAGGIDVAALEAMLDERVKLVSLVHVPTQSGLVQPAAAVGAVTRAAGVPLLLDA